MTGFTGAGQLPFAAMVLRSDAALPVYRVKVRWLAGMEIALLSIRLGRFAGGCCGPDLFGAVA